MNAHRRVLLVEDEPSVRNALADALATSGYSVTQAENGVRALAAYASEVPHVVISDVRMPDMNGLELLQRLGEQPDRPDVVLMTAYDDMDTVVTAMKHGALEFLVKPVDLDELLRLLERIFADQQLRSKKRPAVTATPAGVLVGRDPGLIEVYKAVGQAAKSRGTTVLVRGESGTGKELVARAIHAHSAVASSPFVAVNFAALPSTLLESELFGHTRGAFTGAVQARIGRFARAGNGTVFLDEIGDTTLDLQTRLLRVLQDREYQPVGSDETERSEARVIAATHRDLEQLVKQRKFREDLYYRLRVMEIVIPPLRERPGDILLLAEQFLERAAQSLGTQPAVLAANAQRKLVAHHWPGNVRELEHCLVRAVVVARGSVIRADDLSLASPERAEAATSTSLRDMERDHIARVLALANGQKSRAAELLGIPRARLNRLIQRYGLE
jgi:DNA-binding NtrC family response regulator